ncbi:MAG: hypothetical protein M0Z76_00070 [Gammaproteobacteria bacterium]|nr:hypothetical protein [Gammaproteobacteria bacterium]
MKQRDISQAELAQLLRDEGWDKPLAPVRLKTLKPWHQAVFWGLRLYIVVMLIIVIWAFGHGHF